MKVFKNNFFLLKYLRLTLPLHLPIHQHRLWHLDRPLVGGWGKLLSSTSLYSKNFQLYPGGNSREWARNYVTAVLHPLCTLMFLGLEGMCVLWSSFFKKKNAFMKIWR